MTKKLFCIALIAISMLSCTTNFTNKHITKDLNLSSQKAFYLSIDSAFAKCDSIDKALLGDSIFVLAKINNWIPLIFDSTAVFIYKTLFDTNMQMVCVGDFNNWSATKGAIELKPYKGTKLYTGIYNAPSAKARIDYKFIEDGETWVYDINNPNLSRSGMGVNSQITMPKYEYPKYVNPRKNIAKGKINKHTIKSKSLGYDVNYIVYTPANYNANNKYKVLFTTDGNEYLDETLGAVNIVADNLIADNLIDPIIIVFIDPRDTKTLQNRRMQEYANNKDFVNFISEELYNQVKNEYSIIGTPQTTGILGTSMGGLNSAAVAANSADKFGLIAIQSPAFKQDTTIYADFEKAGKQDLKIYIDYGLINDTQEAAEKFTALLDKIGYEYQANSFYEGHSWGLWRSQIDKILLYFYSKNK